MSAAPHILVCIWEATDAQQPIAAGRRLADEQALPLKVIGAFRHPNSRENAQMMQRLYNLCAKYNAELTVLFHRSPAMAVAISARQSGAVHLVCQTPVALKVDLVAFFQTALPDVPLTLVEPNGQTVTLLGCSTQTVS